MVEEESTSRDGHEGAGGSRERPPGDDAQRADARARRRRDGRATLLRGDRCARSGRRRGDVGRRRPRERARPGGRHRAGGRARLTSASCSARCRTCASRSSRPPPRTSAAACSGGSAARSPGPGSLSGVAPTGRSDRDRGLRPADRARRADPVQRRVPDSIALPRQIGMMPPQGSTADQRMMGAFNAKTRLTSRLSGGEAELVAEGVWVVQGQPGRCNVYLIEDDGGVTLFDAGARTMTRAVGAAPARSWAASAGWCSATDTPTTAARRRRWACPCCATPTRWRTPRAAAAFATGRADLAGLPPGIAPAPAPAAPLRLGRRAGEDLGHARRGR